MVEVREAARVLLVDARERVLLFSGADPHRPQDGRFWFTPGGGLEPGETHQAGAVRELAEETGLRGLVSGDLGEPVWERDSAFEFESVRYQQHEFFFLLRIDQHDVDVSGFSDTERRTVHEHRWWPLDELRVTSDVVYPGTLAVELTQLLIHGPPPAPRRVVSDDSV